MEAAGFPALELCPEMSNSSLLCTEGSSLLPLVESPTTEDWKQAVFWQYPRGGHWTEHISKIMGYTIRTDEWRYTEWVRSLSKFLNVQYFWFSELSWRLNIPPPLTLNSSLPRLLSPTSGGITTSQTSLRRWFLSPSLPPLLSLLLPPPPPHPSLLSSVS